MSSIDKIFFIRYSNFINLAVKMNNHFTNYVQKNDYWMIIENA